MQLLFLKVSFATSDWNKSIKKRTWNQGAAILKVAWSTHFNNHLRGVTLADLTTGKACNFIPSPLMFPSKTWLWKINMFPWFVFAPTRFATIVFDDHLLWLGMALSTLTFLFPSKQKHRILKPPNRHKACFFSFVDIPNCAAGLLIIDLSLSYILGPFTSCTYRNSYLDHYIIIWVYRFLFNRGSMTIKVMIHPLENHPFIIFLAPEKPEKIP